jgi:hypothetical protein
MIAAIGLRANLEWAHVETVDAQENGGVVVLSKLLDSR